MKQYEVPEMEVMVLGSVCVVTGSPGTLEDTGGELVGDDERGDF